MKRKVLMGILLAVPLLAASVPAGALEVEIRLRTPPPIVRAEVIPPAPSPAHYWIPGHWGWQRGGWVWLRGHWAEARRDEVWVRAHWVRVGGEWVFRPGHWRRIVPPRGFVEVVTETPPPIAKVEVVPAPPSTEHFWVPGHWRWTGTGHAWVPGHWELSRAGEVWVPAHWVRVGNRWYFHGGHWQPV